MTHSEQSKLAQELRRLLESTESPYRRALSIIDSSILSESPEAHEIQGCLDRLEPVMRQTQEIENDLAPCRQQWLAAGYRGDADLQRVFRTHQQLLGSLIQKINFLEAQMQSHRAAAVPMLDQFVRHQQAHRAYQQHTR